jgi:ribosomal small subunit protein bTHX
MGKGDQRSRRGKIQIGSFGNLRPRKKRKTVLVAQSTASKATKKAAK